MVLVDSEIVFSGGFTTFQGLTARGIARISLKGIHNTVFTANAVASWPETLGTISRLYHDVRTSMIVIFAYSTPITDTYATANFPDFPILSYHRFAFIEASTGSMTIRTRIEYGKIFGFVPEEWEVIGYPKNTSFIVDSIEYDFAQMGEGYKDSKEDGGLD
jgi:hypothetical protein